MENADNIQDSDFMVHTRCMTYNQENYIEDAMTGFSMQQTNFPYVAVIIDDASTDHNADVIRNYMRQNFNMEDKSVAYMEQHDYGDLWFARHRTNPNCYFATYFLKENHYQSKKSKVPYIIEWHKRAKYIALCEGDDFWIERNKLQRQVDFFETHPECDLVFHNALMRFQDQDRPDRIMREFETGFFTTAQIFEKWQLPAASIMYRKELADCDEMKQLLKVCTGGFLYFIAASMRNKVYGISECWSVYRKNKGGVSNAFSPGFCLKLDMGLAYATEDKSAIATMDEIAVNRVYNYMPAYQKKDPKALEMVEVANSFNKNIFQKARRRYLLSLPSRAWGHFKKLFR